MRYINLLFHQNRTRVLAPFILGCLFAFGGNAAQAQELVWAKGGGGIEGDEGRAIAVDDADNTYVTGQFENTAIFGAGEMSETELTTAGFVDIFVAKYAADGALIWAKQAGGSNIEAGRGIAVDGSGNTYVTGFFRDTAVFGPGEINETALMGEVQGDFFLAKYDPNGQLIWAKSAGGIGFDEGRSIGLDDSGNVYVTGVFDVSLTLGPGEINETLLIPEGTQGRTDFFVAKFSADGTLVWAKQSGGADTDQSLGIALDGSGNSYVTGFFSANATFGQGEVNETTLILNGNTDAFVAKYDNDGGLVWAKSAGGTDVVRSNSIGVDGTGNAYIIGFFTGTTTFGLGDPGETTFINQGFNDIFLAKYDANGNFVWAIQAGGASGELGRGIAVDVSGNASITGRFFETLVLGPGEVNETTLTTNGQYDIFVAKYDNGGDLVWATSAGGITIDEGRGIALNAEGNSYVTGHFLDSATFGAGETGETTLTSIGSTDVFVAKFGIPNQAPVAAADAYNTNEGTLLNVPASGVLTNDSDPDSDPLTTILVAGAGNGDLTLNTDGSFSYLPDAGFVGIDTFTYKANDSTADSNAATVTIAVEASAGPTCRGVSATIVGTMGNDLLIGTAGDDVIVGFDGDDIIRGKGGNDLICGGKGHDLLIGGAGDDELHGARGFDELRGNNGHDELHGGSQADWLYGGDGIDLLRGKRGADELNGGLGDDELHGGKGADWLRGQEGNDTLFGGKGIDDLEGNQGNDSLNGGAGSNDACWGGAGTDTAQACELLYGIP